jgi:hypothetical protein
MCHADKICHTYINADEYTLAHLVDEEDAKVTYVYDLGDKWTHTIEVPRLLVDFQVVCLPCTGRTDPLKGGE